MDPKEYTTLVEAFGAIPDPRKPKGVRYSWQMLLGLVAAAMVSGQQHGRAIGQWVAEHSELLKEILGRQRLPSEATLRRALRVIDLVQLEVTLGALAREEVLDAVVGLAIDGKEVRGARAHGRKVHLVGLVDQAEGKVLSQVAIDQKSNEIRAVPVLLEGRNLTGTVITVDALLTQRELARQILDQGGHYLMVVKENQPQTRQAIEELFADTDWQRLKSKPYWRYQSSGKGHGRYESRVLEATTDANEYLRKDLCWPAAGQVMRRTTTRVSLSTGEVSRQSSYAITSLSPKQAGAKELESLWRGHWSIENKVHYVRDVTMGEDASQAHVGNTPQAMAALRNALIGLVRRAGWQRVPDALRHYNAHPLQALQLVGL